MALPLYDNQPTRRAPLVTYLLIAANVVIFLLSPVASIGHRRSAIRWDDLQFTRGYREAGKRVARANGAEHARVGFPDGATFAPVRIRVAAREIVEVRRGEERREVDECPEGAVRQVEPGAVAHQRPDIDVRLLRHPGVGHRLPGQLDQAGDCV